MEWENDPAKWVLLVYPEEEVPAGAEAKVEEEEETEHEEGEAGRGRRVAVFFLMH